MSIERSVEVLQIPGFELMEKIGQGGMAVVWKARQVSLDRVVAIKFLQPQLAGDCHEVERLLTEARSAAKLKHNGIVQVYDANVVDGIPYVVMEYIAGYNVGDWVRRKGRLEERDVLLVAECVATALHHAWTVAGIIHCDIKPDNIMVDRDGTIKVADLGLARTIGPRSGRASPEEIMGTPSYISPEQSKGGVPLDCRTDIYALGAMMYHLVAGRRLFEQYEDLDAMDRQITDQEPDPMELNPAISLGLAWLIEKMLVKDREGRQADWAAVLKDIHAVQQGHMPASPPPSAGQVSTVKRSPRRHVPLRHPTNFAMAAAMEETPAAKSGSGAGGGKWLALVLVLALAAAGVWVMKSRGGKSASAPAARPTVSAPASPSVSPATAPAGPSAEERAQDVYDYVKEWAAANPELFPEIIEKYRKVAAQTKGTRYALMAEEAMRHTQAEWRRRIDAALLPLRQETERLCQEGQWREAADRWEDYSGVWAKDTLAERQKQAREWRDRASAHEAEQKKHQAQEAAKFAQWVAALAEGMVTGGPPAALAAGTPSEPWTTRQTEAVEIQSLLTRAQNADAIILDSYRTQLGQEVEVARAKGDKIQFVLQQVDPKGLYGEQTLANGARIGLTIPLADIALAERFQRLGTQEEAGLSLARGLLLCQAGYFGRAAEHFAKVGDPLGSALVKAATGIESRRAEENAAAAAIRLLKQAGSATGEPDEAAQQFLRGLDEARWQESVRQVGKFMEVYGQTAAAAKLSNLWETARQSRAQPPLVVSDEPPAAREPPPPPPGGMVDWERVQRSLLDRNPNLKSECIQVEQDGEGRPVRIVIRSPEIQDAAPLEICDSVQDLVLSPADENDAWYRDKIAGLRSLAAVRRMPLRKLNVSYTLIDDLKPLAVPNSRLVVLNLRRTGVSDLSPLLPCPIEELILSGTEVKSLHALRGKNLRRLEINGLKVNDLSPLSGKPLRVLEAGQTSVRDLNPLRNMPLVRLNLAEIGAFDFGALKTLTLIEDLDVSGTQFKDLTLVKAMPLRSLRIARTKIGEITPLKEMNLRALDIADTPVRDLEPISRLPLERLNLSGTKVNSLAPLQKMRLRHLELARTPVRALDPLQGQPLEYLDLSQTEISDLSVIKTLPLKRLMFNPRLVREGDFLKRHPTLEEVWIEGGVPRWLEHTLGTIPYLRMVNGERVRR